MKTKNNNYTFRTFRTLKTFLLIFILTSQIKSEITLLSETNDKIIIKFTLPIYTLQNPSKDQNQNQSPNTNQKINGKQYTKIKMQKNFNNITQKGYPALPYFHKSIAIPNGKPLEEFGRLLETEIIDIVKDTIFGHNFLPSKGAISRNVNPESIAFSFSNVYYQNKLFPPKIVKTGKPYTIRDMRGIVIYIYPFQCNPIKEYIVITKSITLLIKKNNGVASMNNKPSDFRKSLSFNKLYKNHFLNSPLNQQREDPVADGDKMIIISANRYINALEPLLFWKNRKGIKTKLYEYPSETGGEGCGKLKDFIREKYKIDNITYFLLVGDLDDIPSRFSKDLWNSQEGYMDPDYVLLDGDDFYPDAFIGRLSVESVNEAETMVYKIIKYEKNPDTNGEWYHKAIGIASEEGSPLDYEWMNGFRDSLMGYTYTNIDQIYDPSAKASDVVKAINAGRSFVNYMGHGQVTAWGTSGFSSSRISDLSNGSMLPFIISVACLNGKFDENCFAETWTRYEKGGAIAFLGASFSQPWTPPQYGVEEMISLICKEKYQSLGAVIFNSEMKMLDATSSSDTSDMNISSFLTWTLFGDPSLMYYTNTPVKLQAIHDSEIANGVQDITINIEDGSRICLYSPEQNIFASRISDRGTVTFTDVNVISNKLLYVTGTKFNKAPYLGVINANGIGITHMPIHTTDNMQLKKRGNTISINLPKQGKFSVTVYDSRGRNIVNQSISGIDKWQMLNFKFPNGIFFISISIDNALFVKKFTFSR